MNSPVADKTKNVFNTFLTEHSVSADDKGNIPTVIELLRLGSWRTPNHGDFMVTMSDLEEYVQHFVDHISLPGNGAEGAPIDYKHEREAKAAGWIKRVYISEDSLMGEIVWTPQGKQAIVDGEFKFFSPQFYPKGRGGWPDPENSDIFVDNVLVGGGLTNIPLFKSLTPVKASASNKNDPEGNVTIYIKASEIKENENMNLADIRAKEADQLSDEEKDFLAQDANKSQLTDEEKTKFGLAVAAAPAETEEQKVAREAKEKADADAAAAAEAANANPTAPAVAASIASGESVVIKASEYQALRSTAEDYRLEKATQEVKVHVARGAIKADQVGEWAKRIVADPTAAKLLEGLADNPVLADEQGSDSASKNVISAADEIRAKAVDLVKTAKEAGQEISAADAMSKVMASDTDLATRYNDEVNGRE